jgi:hypothetical protein
MSADVGPSRTCPLLGTNLPHVGAINVEQPEAASPPPQLIVVGRFALGSRNKDRSLSFYLCYLPYYTELARKWDMNLRDLDHALWNWSKHRESGPNRLNAA